MRALSLYKRGLRCIKKQDQHGAMEGFTAAIESPGAPDDLRAMALYNRALLFAALDKVSEAVDDLNAILTMADPLREIKLAARSAWIVCNTSATWWAVRQSI